MYDTGSTLCNATPAIHLTKLFQKSLADNGISTVGPSGTCAPLTFSLLNLIVNKHIAYLTCSCYTHMNNLELVATLCSHKSIFHAARLLLAV